MFRKGASRAIRRALGSSESGATRDVGSLPHGIQGAADPHFASAVRFFATLFPGPRYGGGALAVYQDGRPVVDVWTGWADRRGEAHWTADTAAMAFSATKGAASTVIHRLVERDLLSYDAPVARFWPEFGARGKSAITVRDVMAHRAGLSLLGGVGSADLLDERLMEERLAAAPSDRLLGKSAYHALTYGWLVSGLARATTGLSMRELFRSELAGPLCTEGLYLGRPPAGSPVQVAEILMPQGVTNSGLLGLLFPRLAASPLSGGLGAFYVPGLKSLLQGDMPFLDSEIPSANGVMTARSLAKMYGAMANGGHIGGTQFLSAQTVAGLTGRLSRRPDRNVVVPMSFHLGYHASPVPGVMPGFGHAGVGGCIGWANPATKTAFSFVHNRLITAMITDYASIGVLAALLDRSAAAARKNGVDAVPDFGTPITPSSTLHRGGSA
ncbi:serine hydrolase domain-containing protein [Mycobacterium sp. AT1]|uniref:esterase/beta-lactamase LipL n=1 Tax=Mycobacterium sp. AT1 TaxID=1961706 RepID=UPI0009AE823D|nr:serine hydrolase domain-containing protein [Mycobacterium sp. AT1]